MHIRRIQKYTASLVTLILVLPSLVYAQRTLSTLVDRLVTILRLLLPLILVVAFLAFIWRAVKLIAVADNDTTRAEAKTALLWSVLGLLVLVSIWGILELLVGIFFTG